MSDAAAPSLEPLRPISTAGVSPRELEWLLRTLSDASPGKCPNSVRYLASLSTGACFPLACLAWSCEHCGRRKWVSARAFFQLGMNAAHGRGERVRFITLTDTAAGRMTVPQLGAAWNRLAVRLRREELLTEYALAVELQPKRGALHLHALATGSYIPQRSLSSWASTAGFGRIADIRAVKEEEAAKVVSYASKMASYAAKGGKQADRLKQLGAERSRPIRSSRGWYPGGLRAAEVATGLRREGGADGGPWVMLTLDEQARLKRAVRVGKRKVGTGGAADLASGL